MKETIEFAKMLDRVSRTIKTLPQRAATDAVNFSKQRFRDQNWLDNTTENWPRRKGRKKRPGRNILTDTARLRRSIRKVVVTSSYAIIGTDVPYARAHNEGFRGNVAIKAHQRTRPTRGGRAQVKAHVRKVNLPRRRFIGASAVLDAKIARTMTAEISKAIKGA